MKKVLATFLAVTLLVGTQVSTAFAETVSVDGATISNVIEETLLDDVIIYDCEDATRITFTENVVGITTYYYYPSIANFDLVSLFATYGDENLPVFDTSNLNIVVDGVGKVTLEEYYDEGMEGATLVIEKDSTIDILMEGTYLIRVVYEDLQSEVMTYMIEVVDTDGIDSTIEEVAVEEDAQEVMEAVVEEVAVEVTSGTATPTASTVMVDGVEVSFDAYNIDNNNHFKLRDVAYVLNGTEANFEVTWNSELKSIEMISDAEYTEVGSELSLGDGTSKQYVTSTASMYLDGEEVSLIAYTIDGNTYFKLRDLGEALGFAVSWDNTAKVINIVSGVASEEAVAE